LQPEPRRNLELSSVGHDACQRDKSRPVDSTSAGRGAQPKVGYNGKEVDQGVARKAQQEPEGEMEGTETAAAKAP